MKVYETLIEMEKLGYLQELTRGGVISPNVSFYKDIYLYVESRRSCGQSRTQAVTDAEEKFKIKKSTIYKAISIMLRTSVK